MGEECFTAHLGRLTEEVSKPQAEWSLPIPKLRRFGADLNAKCRQKLAIPLDFGAERSVAVGVEGFTARSAPWRYAESGLWQ